MSQLFLRPHYFSQLLAFVIHLVLVCMDLRIVSVESNSQILIKSCVHVALLTVSVVVRVVRSSHVGTRVSNSNSLGFSSEFKFAIANCSFLQASVYDS